MVPCPLRDCGEEVQFSGLLDHVRQCKMCATVEEIDLLKNYHYSHTTTMSAKDFKSSENMRQSSLKILALGKAKFIPTFVRLEGMYYTWVQIIGGRQRASRYNASISVGTGTNTREAIQRKKILA